METIEIAVAFVKDRYNLTGGEKNKDGKYVFDTTCIICEKKHSIALTEQEVKDLFTKQNSFIQNILPNVSPANRELFFLSHICDFCFNVCCAEPDEDEE